MSTEGRNRAEGELGGAKSREAGEVTQFRKAEGRKEKRVEGRCSTIIQLPLASANGKESNQNT